MCQLKAEHVAVVPGSAFGAGGAGFVRCSYATSYEKIEEAAVIADEEHAVARAETREVFEPDDVGAFARGRPKRCAHPRRVPGLRGRGEITTRKIGELEGDTLGAGERAPGFRRRARWTHPIIRARRPRRWPARGRSLSGSASERHRAATAPPRFFAAGRSIRCAARPSPDRSS